MYIQYVRVAGLGVLNSRQGCGAVGAGAWSGSSPPPDAYVPGSTGQLGPRGGSSY